MWVRYDECKKNWASSWSGTFRGDVDDEDVVRQLPYGGQLDTSNCHQWSQRTKLPQEMKNYTSRWYKSA